MSSFRPGELPGFWRRSRGRRLLLLEAAASLAGAQAEVRLVRFRRLAPRLGSFMRETPWEADPYGDRAARAVRGALRSAAAHLPWAPSCLVCAVAGLRMLRRRGLACTLYFGVNREGGALQAHAWLRCGPLPVSGDEQAPAYAPISCIGCFPRRRAAPARHDSAAS